MAQFPGGMDRLEVIGAAIGDIDPAGPLGCGSDAADAAFPQLRFAVAVQPLGASLALGGGRARGHLLVGQAQELLSAGHDRQAVVLQESPTDAIAHGAGPRQGAMGGEVQLGRIVKHEDRTRDLRHLGPRSLEVGGRHRGVRDFGSVAEAIDGARGFHEKCAGKEPWGCWARRSAVLTSRRVRRRSPSSAAAKFASAQGRAAGNVTGVMAIARGLKSQSIFCLRYYYSRHNVGKRQGVSPRMCACQNKISHFGSSPPQLRAPPGVAAGIWKMLWSSISVLGLTPCLLPTLCLE